MPSTPWRNWLFRAAGHPWEQRFDAPRSKGDSRIDRCEMACQHLLMRQMHQSNDTQSRMTTMNNLPGLENLQKFLVLAGDQNFRRTAERLHLTNLC
jgi:hypothetical protein